MEKSSDAFRTISEVADDLSLPQHVLRFWETRFPHIRPLKRAGGRRYYRPTDVVLLRTIRQLLYDEGYTIKGVQRLLKEQGARSFRTGAVSMAGSLSVGELPNAGQVGTRRGDSIDLDDEAPDMPAEPTAADADELNVLRTGVSRDAEGPSGLDQTILRDMLAVIDDCLRILGSVGPRM